MAFDVGMAPFLRMETIQRAIQLNINAMTDEFPIYNLFLKASGGMPEIAGSELVRIDTEYNERRVAPNHGSIGIGDKIIHTRFGQKTVQMVYQHLHDCITPQELVQMRQLGMDSNQSAAVPMTTRRMNRLQNILAKHTKAILRSREILCCGMLSTASFVAVVDGVNYTITTGLAAATAFGGAWSTTSTDIPGLFGEARRKFIDQSGDVPGAIIYSFQQEGNISKNDKIRAWANNQLRGNTPSITNVPVDLLPDDMRAAQFLVHKSHYLDSAGAKQYFWPSGVMTFVSTAMLENVLKWLTCELEIPDGMGGVRTVSDIFSHTYFENKDLSQYIHNYGIGAPCIGDESKVMLFDVTA